jgi:hypothetical protein
LERKIHQVRVAKRQLFDTLFQHHERQLLQEVRAKATGSRRIFTKQLALMKTATEDKAYWVPNMTPDM